MILGILSWDVWIYISAPRVTQLEGNSCEILWETVPPMKGDPVSYILQVLVGRESEYKQVRTSVHGPVQLTRVVLALCLCLFPRMIH